MQLITSYPSGTSIVSRDGFVFAMIVIAWFAVWNDNGTGMAVAGASLAVNALIQYLCHRVGVPGDA